MEKEHLDEYVQLDFFSLLPGSAGGRALREKRGSKHSAQIAKEAASRRTPEERQALHQKGVQSRLRRLYTVPRTVTSIQKGLTAAWRVTGRVIPYYPHRATCRRNKPIMVRIELSVEKVEKYRAEEQE